MGVLVNNQPIAITDYWEGSSEGLPRYFASLPSELEVDTELFYRWLGTVV